MKFGKFKIGRTAILAVLLAAMVAAVAPASAATAETVNFDEPRAPNPTLTHQFTNHDVDMESDSVLVYESNSGDLSTHYGTVNDSYDNPYEYVPTDVNATDFGAFPHAKEDVSALDASEWSTDVSGSSGSMTVSDTETAPGVDALSISTSSQTDGDTAVATFSNFSVTEDEQKGHLAVAMDIPTLDSGTIVDVEVVDEDGDKYVAEINTSRSSGEDFIANQTGEGFVYQRQLGEMDLVTDGDGTFNNIEKVQFVVSDGDFEGHISLLNVEKLSAYDFGTTALDEDDDDELEDVEQTEKKTPGALKVTDVRTLGTTFESAHIKGVDVWVDQRAEDLPAENVHVVTEETGNTYPNFAGTATIYYRFELKTAYDTGFASPELVDNQSVTSERILSVELAEGVSDDTAFENATYSDVTDLYGTKDTTLTLDDTVEPGSDLVVKYTYKLQEDTLQNIGTSAGGGAGFHEDTGFFDGFLNWLVAGLAGIGGSLAILGRFKG
jgi:hypothetical protein